MRRSRLAGDPSIFVSRSDREQARSYKKRGRPQLRSPDEIREQAPIKLPDCIRATRAPLA
ncbi:hypothetical protein PSEUDO8O_150209 [Pseudomonas sp. 8O]|nr:hypothetical protein PSEUDO8O_150209 [Pseudomonas sp. 8O]